MDYNIATYALLVVRYRSAEEAIAFIMQPEFGLYRHPFIGYIPRIRDDELGVPHQVCYLCQSWLTSHYIGDPEEQAAPDQSDLAKELAKIEEEEPMLN